MNNPKHSSEQNSEQNKTLIIQEALEHGKELVKLGLECIADDLLKRYENQRQGLEQFIQQYSTGLDKIILQTEATENLNFQAGKAFLKLLPNDEMQFSADLYYQNQSGAWVNKKTESFRMSLIAYLTDEAISELKQAKEFKFQVDKP